MVFKIINGWKSHGIPIAPKIQLTKLPIWPVAMYCYENWTLERMKKDVSTLHAFEIKGLRKILRVLWTMKKTNGWVLNKDGVKTELLKTVKAKKVAYYGHNCLEKEIMQGTVPGACRRGRSHTAFMDIKTWIGLTMEESVRIAEDGDKLRKYVHDANTRVEDS